MELFLRRSVKDPVLYDDDGELVQENRISGICQFPKETEMFKRLKRAGKRTKVVEQSGSSDDEGLLFDDIFGEEKASFYGQNYEMNDFIVSEEKSYGEGSSLRWLKMNKKKMEQVVTICLSALDDKVPITDDANQTLNHLKQVQASKVNLDNSSEFEPFFLANKYTTERDDLIRQTDTPERMQAYFVAFNPLRTEERSVEVSVLLNKIKKEDIMRFLELHHVEKFDKRKSVLQMHQRKIYDEECLKIDNSEKYTLNKQLFESISKSLNEAEMKEEIDDMDAKYTLNKLLSRFNIICTIYNLCYLDSFDCRC
ncbi:hypothetical protein GOBAR_AA26986 [Gossypium barbadense]|uniref:Spt6 acidic N-terminal domain-containing protein n=1 Tax=Gossypium barbadense TaxID=3634 RepID=A0A2P5WRG7_GOSBA|nr:hypothetical protein GOBAR_AA26986 [Gossypium barbadense]